MHKEAGSGLRMSAAMVFLILLSGLAGCETNAHRYAREREERRERIQAISVGQPVNQADADVLAQAYWRRYFSICGLAYPVRDEGNFWAAHVVAGYIPVDKPDILIEKSTGRISSAGRPTITDWNELCP